MKYKVGDRFILLRPMDVAYTYEITGLHDNVNYLYLKNVTTNYGPFKVSQLALEKMNGVIPEELFLSPLYQALL